MFLNAVIVNSYFIFIFKGRREIIIHLIFQSNWQQILCKQSW